jgi:hypothetical protein
LVARKKTGRQVYKTGVRYRGAMVMNFEYFVIGLGAMKVFG